MTEKRMNAYVIGVSNMIKKAEQSHQTASAVDQGEKNSLGTGGGCLR